MLDIIKERLLAAIETRMESDFNIEQKSSYEGMFVDFQKWMLLRHRDTGMVFHLEVDGEKVRIFQTNGPTANYLIRTMEMTHGNWQVPPVETFADTVCQYIEDHCEREADPAAHYFES